MAKAKKKVDVDENTNEEPTEEVLKKETKPSTLTLNIEGNPTKKSVKEATLDVGIEGDTVVIVLIGEDYDQLNDLESDIRRMKLGNAPVTGALLEFPEKSTCAGRIVNRAVNALSLLNILATPMEWNDKGGEAEFTLVDRVGKEAGSISRILMGMAERSKRKMGYTQHSLTAYDLFQAIGLVGEAKDGDERAEATLDWANPIIKEIKRAEAKAKRKKAKSDKDEGKSTVDGRKGGTKNNDAAKRAASKAKAMAKEEEGDLGEDDLSPEQPDDE